MDQNPATVTTRKKARAIIEELARLRGTYTAAFRREAQEEARKGRPATLQLIEGNQELRENLAQALKAISKDLYTSQARFMMEVIQNADDNKYSDGETPTVCITVFPEHVKVECNEKGFSRENIQALCRTARSSKPPGQGYTGEKGIGFKSVFKLANRAHIRSPPYYFQLDQKRDLGMITPRWDEDFFDNFEEEHQTTIVLDHICGPLQNFSIALKKDFEAIDPVLVLFLRRIERLQLKLFKSSSDDKPLISKCFQRVDWTPDSGIVSLRDEDANTKRRFYKHRFTVDFKGTETRRPGMTKTDIVLAFPVKKTSDTYMPSIRKQNFAFAYLPLGDFGFKFIIQADFLTTSNRQSVDEDSEWNKNIADSIPRAFEAVINNFNSSDTDSDLDLNGLAGTWPLYLNSTTGGLSTYWQSIKEGIDKHLSKSRVIIDRSGSVNAPECLKFLDWVHDRNGVPMFGSESDYVSFIYPESVRETLLLLGVTVPTWSWLCDKIQGLHDENLLYNRMRSKKWCSDLARVILKAPAPGGHKTHASYLRRVPLIPLADGDWRCPPSESDPIYFPASSGTTIPPGLPLSLVDEKACSCPRRNELFRLLGVKDCNVSSVVERIFDYHNNLSLANPVHIIAQLRYLHRMREHLQPIDMRKIFFKCSAASKYLRKGTSTYADISEDSKLQQLFSGYSKAHFLHGDYFADLKPLERIRLAEWLGETADVALAPRLISTYSPGLHQDFEWLLINKSDQVLTILKQHWSLYSRKMTTMAQNTVAEHEFLCTSGERTALRYTYIPFSKLVQKTQMFGNAERYQFLTLPSGDTNDWIFLSRFGVGLDENLDFYLWVLQQPGFIEQEGVRKPKNLYQAIQSHSFSPDEEEKVREAFEDTWINLPESKYDSLQNCIWDGPKGFSSKSLLLPVYGQELDRLFRKILRVPNATSAEAQDYLEQLKDDESTTMADVTEVYVFLQQHYVHTFSIDTESACIAIPSLSSGSGLEWKTPAECVWDDDEFSRNELNLESKTAIRHTIEQHAPTARAFFTNVLQLPNAGIAELLADLALMQQQNRNDSARVDRLYERLQSHRRKWSIEINKAFEERPLVFLCDISNPRGQWLSLKDCIWTRSVLRSKHDLMASLNPYRDLFRSTLGVPNATIKMLVTDLMEATMWYDPMKNEDKYQYAKELLQEIAHLQRNDEELDLLDDEECWPCSAPMCPRGFSSLGCFYVNDRQDLFEIFSGSHTFLDYDFYATKNVAGLLLDRGCDLFLSQQVEVETESYGSLEQDHDLTQDFRSRADALVEYFEYAECNSPHMLRPLLENVQVWMSADIKTKYTLEDTTVTKGDGGSSIRVISGEDNAAELHIYVSRNRHKRDCALITDLPEQLIEALELGDVELPDLPSLLHVPLPSLNTLLIRKGIIGQNAADDYEETLVADLISEDSQNQSNASNDGYDSDASNTSAIGVPSNTTGSVIVETTRASARSEGANMALQPLLNHRPNFRPSTPEARSRTHLNIPPNESPRERPVTPRPTVVGLYSTINRARNRERLQGFARNADPASSSRRGRPSGHSGGGGGTFDMSALRETLEVTEPVPRSTPVDVNPSPSRRAGPIPNRSEEEMARDFEVGFLGEQFVYTLLHDTLQLPGFTGEDNWTSSLRSRAGFLPYSHREVSDLTYKDTHGALTRHFLQMQHPYTTPEWLSTACDHGNVPLYRLEVKSTTKQDPATTFYMSGAQHKLAKKLRVTSRRPSEVYAILRISGLDALEEGSGHRPQWRVYLDPYTRGEEGVLNFVAPTYAVTATV